MQRDDGWILLKYRSIWRFSKIAICFADWDLFSEGSMHTSYRHRVFFAVLLVVVFTGLVEAREPRLSSVRRELAPPISGGLDWINSKQPLEMEDLRGKFVILDFWTYCCINCIQTLPELKKLEKAYPNELVVIGVHAPKFFGERDTENIREAVVRYEVEHPVVNDANTVIAKRYGVKGWPTLYVIDPQGYLVATHYGEATFNMLDSFMKRAIPRYRRNGVLDSTPLHFDLEINKAPATPLRYPGKVLADRVSDRLFIADSGYHRIVITSLDGKLLEVIGTGQSGAGNGLYSDASFSSPQGMALQGNSLYVADTNNHMIRRVDLKARRVSTIAGTGEQLRQYGPVPARRAKSQRLASPWDLYIQGDNLFVAMAGVHQIWRMSLDRGRIGTYAGNGVEDIVDGPLVTRSNDSSSFAQPSGFASDGQLLFVADSEGSAIRAVPVSTNGQVVTVLGPNRLKKEMRLFTYGDRDGPLPASLLQHPIGVAFSNNRIFVADTYNNKIKAIDLRTRQIRTIAGTPAPGNEDSPARFDEPAGLSFAGGKLYVADTNNHAIRIIDIADKGQVSTLELQGLEPPQPVAEERSVVLGPRIKFNRVVRPNRKNELEVDVRLELPSGSGLNRDLPISYRTSTVGKQELFNEKDLGKRVEIKDSKPTFRIRVPLQEEKGKAPLRITITFFYCESESKAICKIGNVTFEGLIAVDSQAKQESLQLAYQVK